MDHFAAREDDSGQAERFRSLREQTGTADMEEELKKLSEGDGDAGETADKLEKLAEALRQERERRLQSRIEGLTRNQQRAAELRREAENRRDGGPPGGQGAGRQPGESASGNGRENGSSPGNGGGPTFAEGTRDLAGEIDDYHDEELERIARELEKAAPEVEKIAPLAAAERRLADLVEELAGQDRGNASGSHVPPAFRRAVEDYYRALSDDFGGEESH